jgi:hypothetical protein
VVGAERQLLELEAPPPEIVASVRRLREEHGAREERDARHRERERQEDWRVGAPARAAFFVGLAAAGLGVWLGANDGEFRYRGTATAGDLAGSMGIAVAVVGGAVFALRRRLLGTEVNARLVYGVLVFMVAMFVHRLASCFPVDPTPTVVSTDLVFCAFGSAFGGVTLARWAWLQVPIWLAAAFFVRAMPSFAGLTFAVAAVLCLGVGLWQLGKVAERSTAHEA